MATIATIPRDQIDKIQLFVNNERMTLSAIRSATGADYAINGTLYNKTTWKPVMHFRVNGTTLSSDADNYHAFGWNDRDFRALESKDKNSVQNYICGTELLVDGQRRDPLYYDEAVGGVRGRTAIGITKAGDLMLYCVGDGQVGRCTPEELRDELAAIGCKAAIMLDSGGSSQCIFPNGAVSSSRIVENVILVFLKKEGIMPDYECTVCLDAGHGGKDNSNGAPDGSYKEHEFALDLAKRIKNLLISQGIKVIMTRESDTFIDLQPRCNIANNAHATLFLSIHSNAAGGSGWNSSASGLCAYTYAVGGKRDDLANAILSRMKAAGVKLLGAQLYHAGFHVLKYTDMPACLVEYGFHTNKADVELLKNSVYRDKLALETAKGICDYLHKDWKEDKPAEPKKKYTVQFATFEFRESAEAVVSKLAELGINAVIKEE